MMNSKTTWIVSHNRKSKGAKALAKALGIKQWPYGHDYSEITTKQTFIAWGNTRVPPYDLLRVINPSEKVLEASDKTSFFTAMSKAANPPRLPEWTTDPKIALAWTKDGDVLARTLTNSSGGKGIVFYTEADLAEFLHAHLFTKYIKKMAEYRVHFAFGKQIDVQKKGLRHDIDREAVDKRIQTHQNGYVFMRHDLVVPGDVVEQARLAYAASGLDFGAVDVIWNAHYARAYVLEINTAPGLEGATVETYAKAFKEAL